MKKQKLTAFLIAAGLAAAGMTVPASAAQTGTALAGGGADTGK